MVCGQTKNFFKSKKMCIVCTSGDDSYLGFKCSNLKKCKVGGRRTIEGGHIYEKKCASGDMEYKGGLKNVTSNDKVKNVMRGGEWGERGGGSSCDVL